MADTVSLPLMTERLMLRDFVATDLDDIHAVHADPDVMRFMLTREPESPAETTVWLRSRIERTRRQPRDGHVLAVALRADGRVIGEVWLHSGPSEDFPGRDEVGFGYMLHRAYWGQGYATEAARAIVDFGFSALHAEQISAWCSAENWGSARVLEKAGLRLAIREHGIWPKTGRPTVSLKYTIGRTDRAAGRDRGGDTGSD